MQPRRKQQPEKVFSSRSQNKHLPLYRIKAPNDLERKISNMRAKELGFASPGRCSAQASVLEIEGELKG
jgi:hypothetical protein